MKKILIALLAATVFWQVNAADSPWLTDLPTALAKAKAEHKIVLLDFTGSDWCEGCIELRKNVLDAKEFQDYAATNVVLVEVDFPMKKAQDEALKKANAALKEKYKAIYGFPAVVVLDAEGKEIGRQTGYFSQVGPQALIAKLEKFKKR